MTQTALQKGVELLARREHAVGELRQKLLDKGFEHQQVDTAIEQLIDRNYLSDERYAEQMLRYRVSQGKGPLKISNDLRVKGVSSTIVQAVLAEYPDEYWSELAKEVYQKKFGDYIATEPKARAKWQRFLASRGFEYRHFPATCDDF